MSTSFIEKLYSAAEAVVAKSIRLVGGQDSAGNVAPLSVEDTGGLAVSRRQIPQAFAARTMYEKDSFVIDKGVLNKFKSRLGVLGESQESSRSVMGVVTTDRLSFLSSTAPFQVGETITGGTSLATGIVTKVTTTSVDYTPTLGVFVVADVITGSVSLATATVTSITTPNLVGQIIKIPQDNVVGLSVTVETDTPSNSLDLFEGTTPSLVLMWATVGLPAVRDTTNKTQGAASMKMDHSTATTYTHTVQYIKHGVVTGGPFQVGDTITGSLSGATALVGALGNGLLRLVSVVGVFQVGDVLTGSLSLASATATSALLLSEDWSGFENLSFDFRVSTKPEQAVTVAISDGVNIASATLTNVLGGVFDTKVVPLAALANTGLPAPVNLGGITSYSFTTATKFKANYTSNIDNMVLSGVSGSMSVSLYDLGATLPVSGVATLAGGIQKLLGDVGIDGAQAMSLTVPLDGGKRLLDVSGFAHGVSIEIPGETLLTPNNYYALVFGYIDTNVKVYGADPAFPDQYVNGYAFSTPSTVVPFSSLGPTHDCMFFLMASETVFVDRVVLSPNADVGNGGCFVLTCEDAAMHARILARGRFDAREFVVDLSDNPVYLPKGGKIELYYTDEFDAQVTRIDIAIRYWSAKADSYVANP